MFRRALDKIGRSIETSDRLREAKKREDELVSWLRVHLPSLGFTLVRDDHYPKSFGDRIIDFSRQPMVVRISLDRAVWGIDIAGPDGEFIALNTWLDVLHERGPSLGATSFEVGVELMPEQLDRIEALTAVPDFSTTAAALRAAGVSWAERAFPGMGTELGIVFESWSRSPDLHRLEPPARPDEIAVAERMMGRPLPAQLRWLYEGSNGFEALGPGPLQVEPLIGTDRGLVGFSDRLRGWGWPIPEELLMFGGNGGDELFGIWYPARAAPAAPAPVVMVGAVFEPRCLALVGADIARFLRAWSGHYLVLIEAPSAAFVALGLPARLWTIDDELGLAPYFAWADPGLPDPNPDPYERGMDAAEISALVDGLRN